MINHLINELSERNVGSLWLFLNSSIFREVCIVSILSSSLLSCSSCAWGKVVSLLAFYKLHDIKLKISWNTSISCQKESIWGKEGNIFCNRLYLECGFSIKSNVRFIDEFEYTARIWFIVELDHIYWVAVSVTWVQSWNYVFFNFKLRKKL